MHCVRISPHVTPFPSCFLSLTRSCGLFVRSAIKPPPFCCFSKVKVCDLERKCRSQTEHFHQLSDELLNFRLRSDTVEILQINPAPTPRISRCSEKNFSRVALGFKVQTKTGGSRLSTHNQTSDRFGIETPGLEQSMVTLTVLWG